MGHLRLMLSFHEEEVGASKIERMLDSLLNIQLDDFIWVKNKYADPNTRHLDRFYGMSTVHAVEFDGSSQTTSWKHPFIAPLKYAFESPAGLSLFSHFASSGHLFGHLQEERRFDIEKATFYAAELVSVLGFLHGQNIVNCLKLENITVDPFGHISICAPGLFALEVSPDKVRSMPGTPEFPAPELVHGNAASKVADWWTLGVFLYEMLTGIPPFYADEYEARKRNITNQDVQLPAEMKPAATDLLLRLLDKVPTRRLGANGVSDVKSHVLFDGIDWRQLQQKHPTSFIPDMISPVYYAKLEGPKIRQVPYTRNPTGRESNPTCRRLEKNGLLVDELSYDFWGSPITRWHELARVRGENTEHTNSQPPAPIPDVDGWKFAWDSDAQELRFENEVTNQEFCVKSPERELYDLAPIESDGTRAHEDSESLSPLFWREALRIALKSNHGTRVIKMILEQGNIDINKAILLYEEPVFTKYLPLEREEIPLNPLEWAVKHDRVDLFHLFLEAGADANKTSEAVKGPALMKAVRRENLHMVKVLAPLTGRVSCTRALGLAVDQQSAAVVEALLEARPPSHEGEHQHQHQQQQHVRSDFEDGDAPLRDYDYIGMWSDNIQWANGGPPAEPTDFTPPLVRAVRFGNADLVRVLLAHGADPNVGYHDPYITIPNGWYDTGEKPEGHPPYPKIVCGRPVQLAMELHGDGEVLRLLLDAGADIALPQPVWPCPTHLERSVPVHTCTLAPRRVYLKVTAALEATVARR